MMIALYSNNFCTDLVIERCAFAQPYQVHRDVAAYEADPAKIKIAFVNHISQYCQPANEDQRIAWVTNGAKFVEEIECVQKISSLVFAFDNEFHAYHCSILQKANYENLYWVVPVHLNAYNGRSIFYTYQFDWTVNPYKNALESRLPLLRPFEPKPKMFDALLGWSRPHRDFVFDAVNTKPSIKNKILLTYMNYVAKNFVQEFLWEPEVEYIQDTTNSANMVRYFGCVLPLSRIVPLSIYNQTAYSIVAETSADNRYTFPTEKIIKPMMARRLFVVFSSVNFLRNLRQLGFRTFDSVIDESYDSIEDDAQRWSAAFEQVEKLCNMDQTCVLDQIQHIVDHNYNIAMNTDWNHYTWREIQQICAALIHEQY